MIAGIASPNEPRALDVAAGEVTEFGGVVGIPPDNTAIMTGLVAGPDGEVYVAVDVFAPQELVSGVYRIPAGGGQAELFASDPALLFPNGFAFEPDGDLLVTDSFSGTIFHVALADGAVTRGRATPCWRRTPTRAACRRSSTSAPTASPTPATACTSPIRTRPRSSRSRSRATAAPTR
uniref:SMP-30/Gluconolactonase/LRE-like region domain-containing protein n=1 Tax=Nannocystis pusilla TaxID=889268 RepID=A0A3Q8I105_9BACT|nr:hypothetical protein [Nannocystis pusilla]